MSKENWKKFKHLKYTTTNFYPQYTDNDRDRVEPISAIRQAQFQKVIPRYVLSASETRDQGVGPMMEDVRYRLPAYRFTTKKNAPTIRPKKLKEQRRKKIRIDFGI